MPLTSEAAKKSYSNHMADLGTDFARTNLGGVLVEVDACIRDRPIGRDEPALLSEWRVRAGQRDFGDRLDLVEQFGHRRLHGRVGDATVDVGLYFEHDRARQEAAADAEVLVQDLESSDRVGIGAFERTLRLASDRTNGGKDTNQDDDPGGQHTSASPESERPESGPDGRCDTWGTVGHFVHE